MYLDDLAKENVNGFFVCPFQRILRGCQCLANHVYLLRTGYRNVPAQSEPTLHRSTDGCKIYNPCVRIAYTERFGHGNGSATAAAIATISAVAADIALAMNIPIAGCTAATSASSLHGLGRGKCKQWWG